MSRIRRKSLAMSSIRKHFKDDEAGFAESFKFLYLKIFYIAVILRQINSEQNLVVCCIGKCDH